jgi:hypothetical protein
MDRAAAALQTYLPEFLGGTGQNYAANLAANRAVTAHEQAQHPADAVAGNLAGGLPLLAVPGVGGAGIMGACAAAPSLADRKAPRVRRTGRIQVKPRKTPR